jgi:glutaredoxin 3
MDLSIRETVGKALRPILTSTALDRVKYLPVVRRFACDWAVAFGLWDDGLLARDDKLGPIDLTRSAAWARGQRQASLTLYVDPRDALTDRARALLRELGAVYREVDISDDEASRKWLADECDGARPPQLFVEGRRTGGFEELAKLHAEGRLHSILFPKEA